MIREYACTECKTTVDRLEKASDTREPPLCEKCGSVTEKVEISVSSFRLYGDGFFKPSER